MVSVLALARGFFLGGAPEAVGVVLATGLVVESGCDSLMSIVKNAKKNGEDGACLVGHHFFQNVVGDFESAKYADRIVVIV